MTPRDQARAWAHSLVEKAFAEGATLQGIQYGGPAEIDRPAKMITEDAKAITYKRTRENVLAIWWKD